VLDARGTSASLVVVGVDVDPDDSGTPDGETGTDEDLERDRHLGRPYTGRVFGTTGRGAAVLISIGISTSSVVVSTTGAREGEGGGM
jgi:hypothetical protein